MSVYGRSRGICQWPKIEATKPPTDLACMQALLDIYIATVSSVLLIEFATSPCLRTCTCCSAEAKQQHSRWWEQKRAYLDHPSLISFPGCPCISYQLRSDAEIIAGSTSIGRHVVAFSLSFGAKQHLSISVPLRCKISPTQNPETEYIQAHRPGQTTRRSTYDRTSSRCQALSSKRKLVSAIVACPDIWG
jgi:hypothetical protein